MASQSSSSVHSKRSVPSASKTLFSSPLEISFTLEVALEIKQTVNKMIKVRIEKIFFFHRLPLFI